MLRHCQHKLAFSKSNWYTCALKAVLSSSEKKVLLGKYQCRPTATLASVVGPSDTLSTFIIPPPPLQPLQSTTVTIPDPTLSAPEEPVVIIEKHERCTGFRSYDGQRCERLVRIDPTSVNDHVLCFNHDPNRPKKGKKKKKKLAQTALNSQVILAVDVQEKRIFETPDKIFDCWQLWIGDHIEKEQAALLRQEMEKPISKRDKPGFIYTYLLSQGPRVSRPTHAYFKIGRTTNPHRRMYQVSNVCKIEPKIIELVPSFPLSEQNHILPTNLEVLEEKLENVPKCPISHRVERLIHLELSSLYKKAGYKCPHCGCTHREWIKVTRKYHPDGTPMTDRELWLSSIRPVILKWVQYGVVASAVNNNKD